jgi:thioredoxin 1
MEATNRRHEPSRSDVDTMSGTALVEFGTPWCGHCRSIQETLGAALARHPAVRHVKVEDGAGRPLGRSFGVRLWPTLVFLRDGKEVARLVRPGSGNAIEETLARIDT